MAQSQYSQPKSDLSVPPPTDIKTFPLGTSPSLILSVEDIHSLTTSALENNLAIYCEALVLGGAISANKTISLDIHSNSLQVVSGGGAVDLSGQPGTSGIPGTGDAGQNAPNSGGCVALSVECFDNTISTNPVQINVAGGSGGAGASSNKQMLGGAGGNGSSGGKAIIALGSVPLSLAAAGNLLSDVVKGLITDDNLNAFINPINKFVTTIRHATFIDGKSLTTVIHELPKVIIQVLGAFAKTLETAITQQVDCAGGDYGVGARGTSDRGANGQSGPAGSYSFMELTDVSQLCQSSMIIAHPDQCLMLLEKAKTLYFIGDSKSLALCEAYSYRLIMRLGFTRRLKPNDPICSAYRNAEQALFIIPNGDTTGVPASMKSLQYVETAASGLWNQLVRQKLDYYGQSPSDVPRGSFNFFGKQFKLALQYLTEIEKSYTAYVALDAPETQQQAAVQTGASQCQLIISHANVEIGQLEVRLDAASRKIAVFQAAMSPAYNELTAAIQEVEKQIMDKVSVDNILFTDVLAAFSQVVAAPESSMASMGALQVSGLLHNEATTIPDNTGGKIDKNLLITQIETFDPSAAGLAEGYKVANNGQWKPEDEGAAKLIAAREQLLTLLAQYSDSLGQNSLHKVGDAYQHYINTVLARNEALLDYNACVVVWYRDQQDIAHYTATAATLSSQALADIDVNIPTPTVFMEKLYADAVNVVLRTLYFTERSYQFWALRLDDPIASTLSGTPFPQLISTLIEATGESLLEDYESAIESFTSAPQSFKRLQVPLSPSYISSFKKSKQTIWTINIAKPNESLLDNPFAGKSNVRLIYVRFYAPGAKTSTGSLQANIAHLGSEDIYNQSGESFHFSHSIINCHFAYKIGTGSITTDGDIGTKSEGIYANVGPFTLWQITTTEDLSPGLDLSAVTGAYLEFDGTFQAFPPP
ncbi:Ff.00g065240.m01.CDS01 [Fusarium sp. VM40]|nr:Ff.00g065240.m01.CDS01 [Fusarium sp. VM40]